MTISVPQLKSIATGYISQHIFEISKDESFEKITYVLKRKKLKKFTKRDIFDEDSFKHYSSLVGNGFCLGVYDKKSLIGFCIAEPETWNSSLWVWEFHIKREYQLQGFGSKLMMELEKRSRKNDLRIIICETQNTNVPAIDFYRKNGFTIDGFDLSYYSNEDLENGEIALFMKKKL